GGFDEQISWATAERTTPDLACVAAVGYSVRPWVDGKEKGGGSIPPGGSTQGRWPAKLPLLPCFPARGLARSGKRRRSACQQSPCSDLLQRGRRPDRHCYSVGRTDKWL